MANIVDELVVKIGLDNSGFKKNAQNVNANVKGIKKSADQTQKSFSDMGVVIGRFFAVLGGATALKAFIKDTIESNAQLSRFSKNMAESAQSISAFKQAAEVTGAKGESMASAIEMITDAQLDLKRTGTTAMIPALNYLGVSLTDVTGKAKPALQVLKELNLAFSKMDRKDAYYYGKQLGLNPDLMNLMLKKPEYFNNLIKDLKNRTATTDKEAENSEKLSEAWNESMIMLKRAPSWALGKVLPNAPSNPNAPRGIRNNNPGNLNFANQRGATKESGPNGRFAVFGSMSEGLDAMINQIGINAGRGKNTIRQMISTWAPESENDTRAYIDFVSKRLGIGPDQALDMNNQEQVKRLVMAIADKENGAGFVSEDQVKAAVSRAKSQKLSSAARSGAASVSGASQASSLAGGGSNKTITIGDIIVNTQAKDPKGIGEAVRDTVQTNIYLADGSVR